VLPHCILGDRTVEAAECQKKAPPVPSRQCLWDFSRNSGSKSSPLQGLRSLLCCQDSVRGGWGMVMAAPVFPSHFWCQLLFH
jgi:hypothetical protein